MPMLQETLTREDAEQVVRAAIAQAVRRGVACSAAVVDAGGYLLSFARRDHARIATVELAINKAFSARIFDNTTEEIGSIAQPGRELYGIQHSHGGRSVVFGGGVPIRLNGVTIGAVGVSGGSVQQDAEIAGVAAACLVRIPSEQTSSRPSL